MEQSHRDSTLTAAWITGGLALAGTVLTLTLQGSPGSGKDPGPLAPPTSSPITPFVSSPAIAPTTSSGPEIPERTPTESSKVPAVSPMRQYLVGLWLGGEAPLYNIHLTITEDSAYVLVDILSPDPNPLGQGRLVVDDRTINFYDIDGTTATELWSFERTIEGDVLQIGSSIFIEG
jgi:hypothetical protein